MGTEENKEHIMFFSLIIDLAIRLEVRRDEDEDEEGNKNVTLSLFFLLLSSC